MTKNTLKKGSMGRGAITVPPRIYNAIGKVDEEKFKDYLQDNPCILDELLQYKRGRVLWIGREFVPFRKKRADFTGVDNEGYFITVEVKVNQVTKRVVDQVKGITAEYRKFKEGRDIDRRVKGYILSSIRNAKWKYFMGPVSEWWGYKEKLTFGKRADMGLRRIRFGFEREYERFFNKRLKMKGIKVFIIAPGIDQRIIGGLEELKKRIPTVQIKYLVMDRREGNLTRFFYEYHELI